MFSCHQTYPRPDVTSNTGQSERGNSASDAIDLLFESASEQGEELLPWLEREFTQRAMERTNNNQVQAAKLLGITRATLRKRVERFNLGEKEAG